MGLRRTLIRARRLFAQGVGVVVALFGLFLFLFTLPPADAETGIVFAVGVFVILLGAGMVKYPNKVMFGREQERLEEKAKEEDLDPHERQRLRLKKL